MFILLRLLRPSITALFGRRWSLTLDQSPVHQSHPETMCSDNLELLKRGRKVDNLENPVENQTHNLRTQTQREHANSTHRETPGNRTTNLLADGCNTVSSAQKTLKLRQKTLAENQNRCFFCACATQWAKKNCALCTTPVNFTSVHEGESTG